METITIDERWYWVFADCNEEVPVLLFMSYLSVICAIILEHTTSAQQQNPNRELLHEFEAFTARLGSSVRDDDTRGMDLVRVAHARMGLPERLAKLMKVAGIAKINNLPDYVNTMLKKRQIFICDHDVKVPGGAIASRINW